MKLILFIVFKIILALYLTEAIIIIWRIISTALKESWKLIKIRFKEEILPTAGDNLTFAVIVTGIFLPIVLILTLIILIIKSIFEGLKWPVTFIKVIWGEN